MSNFGPNVFSGPSAIKDLFNPDNQPPVPLVELPASINPFHGDQVRIFAKLMYLLPLLSIKSLPAIRMLADAQAAGRLEGVHTLVEASSGNTAFSLAIAAGLFGIRKVQAIVPRDIAPGKLELLRLSGADPVFSNEAAGEPSGICRARTAGTQPGFFNPAQYENDSNADAHEAWTAGQIWHQLQGELTVFCCGMGTTGTVVGARRFFDKQNAKVTVVGVTCAPDQAVPGVRSLRRLAEIAFDWPSFVHHRVDVGTKESFQKSLHLCRSGLLAGPSSGFALAGLLKFLEDRRAQGTLDQLRTPAGDVMAAMICADTPVPYLDKYSTHLDPWEF